MEVGDYTGTNPPVSFVWSLPILWEAGLRDTALHAWTSCLQLSVWGIPLALQAHPRGWEPSSQQGFCSPGLTKPYVYSGRPSNLLFSKKVLLRSSTLMEFPVLFMASLGSVLMAKAECLIPLLSSCPSSVAERFKTCS